MICKTRSIRRVALVASLAGAVMLSLNGSALGAFGVKRWEAGTCNGSEAQVKSCEYTSPHSAFYTQAAGHPPWGLTGFELAHTGSGSERSPDGEPLKRLRVDVEPGLAANPQALPSCSRAEFKAKSCKPETQVGFVELEAVVSMPLFGNQVLTLKGKVFNLREEPGLPLLFGIEVEGVEPLVESVQLFLEGHVSYAKEPALEARGVPSGDYHEWFEINNIPHEVPVEALGVPLTNAPLKTLKSKLFFNGRAGRGNFLTLPSVCGAPSLSTSYLEVESDTGEIATASTVPPVGVEKCENVPFEPIAEVMPQNPAYDQPDGAITAVKAPQNEAATNTADISEAHATLPEGLTLNPSAAHGLEACPPSKIHFESKTPAECPAGSKLGKVTIETDLPPGSLAGSLYLGDPKGLPITGPPYTVYAVAESIYDVAVKVEGTVAPDPSTGRLTADFKNSKEHPFNLPELPFGEALLELNTGPRAPLANPLTCSAGKTESDFIAYSGEEIFKQFKPAFPFPTSGCPSPIPFALSQSTQESSPSAGAFTSYTFDLARPDGQQYLSKVVTTLPEGLVGAIPSVTLCQEPQAGLGSCPAASQIGTATVAAGAGPEPYVFSGPVFLTGPYNGAPYGLSIPVPAVAGPFDLGTVVTRAAISVDPFSGRVIVASSLPVIVGGVPLRLKSIDVAVNRSKFLLNPTNCGALGTDTTLTSTFGTSAALSSPFQVSGCSALAFKPKLTASTKAKTSRAIGAALKTKIVFPTGMQANIKSVFVQLPKQLPARISTLNLACREATFNANPFSCPAGAYVGTAIVSTPVLPQKLIGSAVLVSHGGAAFPDLDLLLTGDGGVTVILVGHTNIVKNITSSDFASLPDVPVSSVELKLPQGKKSALGAVGNLCKHRLLMPTTITGQNGKVIRQKTRIAVAGCPRKHKHHHKRHHHRHGHSRHRHPVHERSQRM
jgi:hypothetical protein